MREDLPQTADHAGEDNLPGPTSPFLFAETKNLTNLGPISNLKEWNFWQRDAIRQQIGITPVEAFAQVPWLYRAVKLRATSVGDVPWAIFQGKQEILTSEDDESIPPPELAWIRPPKNSKVIDPTRPTLGDLLRLTEIDLCLSGAAYWLADRGARTRGLKNFRRALPSTIALDSDESVGLKGFTRTIGSHKFSIKLGDMPFWWLENPAAELGPGPSPAYVALNAAGLMRNIDDFGAGFFDRGAINTTILSVKGQTNDNELRKLESWWKRLLRGNRRAHETVALRAEIQPVVVGQPPKDLAMHELTEDKRADVAVALGVPQSVIDDRAANYATAQISTLNFWIMTILPECEMIEEGLNRQVMAPLGYELRFQPKKLEVIKQQLDQKAFEMLAAVIGGVVTPNEMREQIGLEKVPDGEKLRPMPEPKVGANENVGAIPRGTAKAA